MSEEEKVRRAEEIANRESKPTFRETVDEAVEKHPKVVKGIKTGLKALGYVLTFVAGAIAKTVFDNHKASKMERLEIDYGNTDSTTDSSNINSEE